MSIKGELLTALVYDMALVSRLKEQIDNVLSICDIRRGHHLLTSPRVVSVLTYFALCRLIHPKGLTLGEELVELVPSRRPHSMPSRLYWFIASVYLPVVLGTVIPNLSKKRPIMSSILELLTSVFGDIWFLFSTNPTATSLFEASLRPNHLEPNPVHPDSQIKFPKYIFPIAGAVIFARTIDKFVKTSRRFMEKKHVCLNDETVEFEAIEDDGNTAFEPCIVCMGDIKVPTATVCGHIFCWSCIVEWTSTSLDGVPCPTCRTICHPQELVPLVHYVPGKSEWKPFWKKPIVRHPS